MGGPLHRPRGSRLTHGPGSPGTGPPCGQRPTASPELVLPPQALTPCVQTTCLPSDQRGLLPRSPALRPTGSGHLALPPLGSMRPPPSACPGSRCAWPRTSPAPLPGGCSVRLGKVDARPSLSRQLTHSVSHAEGIWSFFQEDEDMFFSQRVSVQAAGSWRAVSGSELCA